MNRPKRSSLQFGFVVDDEIREESNEPRKSSRGFRKRQRRKLFRKFHPKTKRYLLSDASLAVRAGVSGADIRGRRGRGDGDTGGDRRAGERGSIGPEREVFEM